MRPTMRWASLPAGLAIGILIAAPLMLALIPQLLTLLFTNPTRFGRANRLTLFELLGLWGQPNPTLVTGASVPGAVHWALVLGMVACILTVAALVIVVALRWSKDPQRKPGLAPLKDVVRDLGSVALVKKYGPVLRPKIPVAELRPEDCGYLVGTFWGVDLWLRVEDPTIVIGPSRAGKGWYLILNWLVGAPGAVITTSSKMDNAILTLEYRKRISPGNVWVFAPGIAGGESLGHVLRWDPVDGCVDEETLVRRIHALIPKDAFSGSTSNGGHWDTLGQQLAAALFHAAACKGVGVDEIWRWVGSPQRATEAVEAIRAHPEGLKEQAAFLESVLNMPPEQRATQWGVLPTALAFLSSGLSRKWMNPGAGETIDLANFILNKGTLYLVGDKQSTGGYVRVIDGLLAEVDYYSKGLADAMGGRLDPPITYLLDEAGNFEYQGLYELITAGGGRGRVGVAVFQAKEQLGQYGKDLVKTLWDAAVAKIVLPGGADSDDLRAMSSLLGEKWVNREQHSFGHGPASVSVSEEKRAVLEASEIREMDAGYAIMFYRNLKAVIPKLNPFAKNPAYAACKRDAEQLSQQMQQASPFAEYLAQKDGMLHSLDEAEREYA